MQNPETYDDKINRYLEGRMSPEEEVAFVQQLNEDASLRKLYEEELLIGGLLNDKNEMNSGEDDVTIPGVPAKSKYKPNIISMFGKYKNIAAAVLVAAIITTILFVSKNNTQTTSVNESVAQKEISSKNDTLKTAVQGSAKTDSSTKFLFDAYYTSYTSKNDPVEISLFYNYYRKGQYNKVLLAKRSDYAVMGIDDREQLLNQYMYLYKGLSFLANDEPAKAIISFDSVLFTTQKQTLLYYNAKWYSALSYLKLENITKVDSLLSDITNSNSPYKNQALQLAKQIRK